MIVEAIVSSILVAVVVFLILAATVFAFILVFSFTKAGIRHIRDNRRGHNIYRHYNKDRYWEN